MAFTEIGANTLDDSYEISNSLRFNSGDGPKLQITTGTNGDRRQFTFSCWFKIAQDINDDQTLFACNDGGHQGHIRINNDMTLNVQISASGSDVVTTNRKFRDHSAWYHLVVAQDTEQGTAADRCKIYVNGVLEDSFSAAAYTSQNTDTSWNTNTELTIGRDVNGDDDPFDGYMSEIFWIDGTQYAASAFGETNNNGVWIPKDCKDDLTFGTNGFYMQFKQTGTSQNSSGIGADTSGEDNHYAVTNLAAIDVTTDTPTNNFCTYNPLSNLSGIPTLSEGNTKMLSDGGDAAVFGTFGVSNGKWYWELKGTESDQSSVQKWTPGVIGSDDHTAYSNRDGGYAPKATALYLGNSNVYQNNSSVSSAYFTATQNDIIGVAFDADNNKIYWHKNGTYGNSGDPTSGATGTGGISTTAAHAPFIPIVGEGSGHEQQVEANFGNPPFSISSGNSDANGYGNFEYAVPSGYYALCTKNLAKYG